MRLPTFCRHFLSRVQVNKTEFPAKILLWRECECYKITNMDYTYSQSAYNPSEEQNKETLEFLRLGNNDKNSTYELCLNTKFL